MAETMPIQHKQTTLDEFIAPIRERLGHGPATPKPVFDASLAITPHVTDQLDQNALVERFCAEAAALGTELSRCNRESLGRTVVHVVEQNGAGRVILPTLKTFDDMGITQKLVAHMANDVCRWDPALGRERNIELAASANIGITLVYAAIAETATVVQPCTAKCGRSVSLLPSVHIAIIDAKTIVPAMRDVLARLEADRAAGKDIASQTVFISGPSNTADIELVRVEGVHGPTKVTYIIVED
jgi:L-lactate dehydrogenase complex protein LldG